MNAVRMLDRHDALEPVAECTACGAAPLGGPRDTADLCGDCAREIAEMDRADDERVRAADEQRYAASYERDHAPGRM